jgi:hypothetical protein
VSALTLLCSPCIAVCEHSKDICVPVLLDVLQCFVTATPAIPASAVRRKVFAVM